MLIGTGSLTINATPTADSMTYRSMPYLVAARPVAGNVTHSGLIAPTVTNTTDGSGTVKTYASGPVTPVIINTGTALVAYLLGRSDEGRFR